GPDRHHQRAPLSLPLRGPRAPRAGLGRLWRRSGVAPGSSGVGEGRSHRDADSERDLAALAVLGDAVRRTRSVASWLTALLTAAGAPGAWAGVRTTSRGAGPVPPDPGESVTFVGEPRDGRGGARLDGVLVRPEGTGPFPAVVMLHGCTGLRTRTGVIQRKLR